MLEAVRGIRAAANVLHLPRDGSRVANDAINRLEEEIMLIKSMGMLDPVGDGEPGVESEESRLREEERLRGVEAQLQGLKRNLRKVARHNFEQWVDARQVKVSQRDGCLCRDRFSAKPPNVTLHCHQ